MDGQPRPRPLGHPGLSERWVGAGHLRVGDRIREADGSSGVVSKVRTVEAAQEMYNLTVEEAHTFFVGEGQWLVHNCGGAFDDLAKMRRELDLPSAGSNADKQTLAKLEINGQSFYGINAHGTPITVNVNAITRTPAEADALQQAINAGVRGDTATLYVDRALCRACGANGGVRSFVEQMGLRELRVIAPDGKVTIITPRR